MTPLQREVLPINVHKGVKDITGYLVHYANCCAAIIAFPPRSEYVIILVEPCPMCNGGLEQSFGCDYCFQKNAIYWDKRRFVVRVLV